MLLRRTPCIGEVASCSGRAAGRSRGGVAAYAKRGGKRSYQKNEGVYFEYVTAPEFQQMVFEGDDGQFAWVKQARQSHKRLQQRKDSTSASSKPAPPRPRADAPKASAPKAPTQKQQRQSRPPLQDTSAPSPQDSSTPLAATTTATAHADARAAVRQQLQGDLAELLAASGLRPDLVEDEDDVAVGTCYDEDDPVDRQLAAIEADLRMSAAQKARAKLRLLGFEQEGDEEGGARAPVEKSHGVVTTTGAAAEATSGPVQLLGRPARRPGLE